jgi:hypothetical protein
MSVNLDQRHLASDCEIDDGEILGRRGSPKCGAWYKTECVWCQAEIHMHRKQYGKHVQTCSSRCRVALHRAKVAAEGRAPQGPPP